MQFKLFLEALADYLPRLVQLQSNLYMVSGFGNAGFYFSYEVFIGYSYQGKIVVRENERNNTTARHINRIKHTSTPLPSNIFLEEYISDIGHKLNVNNLPTLIGKNNKAFTLGPRKILYFSYETLIAFTQNDYLMIRENQDWTGRGRKGSTTGKHLNAVTREKEKRLDEEMFAGLFNDLYAVELR